MLDLLTRRERRQLYLLVVISILDGILQIVGIASIMPFLAVVTDPSAALENRWLGMAYDLFGFTSTESFLIFLGVAVLAAVAVSNGASAVTTWFSVRFSWMLGHNLSKRILRDYIYRPYEYFLNVNSNALGTKILSEVWEVINSVMLPFIKVVSNAITALLIVGLLVVVDPILALAAAVVLGGLYGSIFLVVRNRLSRLGSDRVKANRSRYQAVGEAFGGIKDVKILGKERTYLDRYVGPSRAYARSKSASLVIKQVPSYALELIAFGGIILIVIYLLATGGNLATVLPVIGLYAFASYRLKPALQSIFSSMTSIRNGIPSLESVLDDLRPRSSVEAVDRSNMAPLPLKDRLELRNIVFRYPGSDELLFDHVDLDIEANTSVAFVGATGSGKTTLVDILMGLLAPQEGEMLIDGRVLEGDLLRAWQNNIGYVPQHIYLSDISIAWNIAFGVPEDQIDMEAVERAAKVANIHDFIVDELPQGYETVVGERGVRLSGGQQQRIGIARALYRDPEVLILDEATSALDGVTEQSVFAAVESVRQAKTVIMIAHRLSTVRDCDVIYMLDHGEVVARGTYDELLDSNRTFRTMALGGAEAARGEREPRDVPA